MYVDAIVTCLNKYGKIQQEVQRFGVCQSLCATCLLEYVQEPRDFYINKGIISEEFAEKLLNTKEEIINSVSASSSVFRLAENPNDLLVLESTKLSKQELKMLKKFRTKIENKKYKKSKSIVLDNRQIQVLNISTNMNLNNCKNKSSCFIRSKKQDKKSTRFMQVIRKFMKSSQ